MRLRIVGKVHPFNQPGLGFGSVVDVEDEALAREYLSTGWVVLAEPDEVPEERTVVELEVWRLRCLSVRWVGHGKSQRGMTMTRPGSNRWSASERGPLHELQTCAQIPQGLALQAWLPLHWMGGASVKIRGFCRTFEGGGFYRVVLPLRELARHGHETECVKATTETGPAGADIMVVHMAGTHEAGKMPEVHRWWRRTALQCRRVYELDDDPFELESHNPAFNDFNSAFSRDSLAYCIQIADLVTTSVEPLAERMRKLNPNVVVCKNRIDESLLSLQRPHRDRLTVGWAGGNSHLHDIQEAAYGLRRVIDWHPEVDVHLMGCDFRPLIRRECRFTPWEPKVADYYRLIDFDIGIAPLRPGVFSSAKSAIKALEYGALGIPVVASDVAPYRDYVIDGVTGWLVRTERDWSRRLRDLINDEAMRTEMSVKAKQQAAEWTIQKGWQDWESCYASIL